MADLLVVDTDSSKCERLASELRALGFVASGRPVGHLLDDLAYELADGAVDVVLVAVRDLVTGQLARFCGAHPLLPVVAVVFGDHSLGVAAVKEGAYDFICDPFPSECLALLVERALRFRNLRTDLARLQRAAMGGQRFEDMLGTGARMRRVFLELNRAAEQDAPLLLVGERGTGKTLAAQSVHQRGPRSAGPFREVRCAGIAESVLEAELFGHLGPTGKVTRLGAFAEAHGGTLVLHEIADVPQRIHSKLLSVLDGQQFRRTNSEQPTPADVRFIATTTRELVAQGDDDLFSQELFARLSSSRIELPQLRDRGADVLLLANAFVQDFAAISGKSVTGISVRARDKLLEYPWPGNVRELHNCVERAVAMNVSGEIEVDELSDRIRNYAPSQLLVAGDDPTDFPSMDEVERRYILRVLEATGGKKTSAARVLGFDRKTLYRKLERYGFVVDESGTLRPPPGGRGSMLSMLAAARMSYPPGKPTVPPTK